jgi:Uncharacterised protein family (UPF0236)
MDITTVAQDVLSLVMVENGELPADLAVAERLIRAQVEKVGRVALQGHLDQHPTLGYQGVRRECSCGQSQRFVNHRPRTIKTVLGEVKAHRAYYHCASCGQGCVPYDQAVGLGSMAVSPGLAKMACELSVDLPFERAAKKLTALTGLTLSASSIERVSRRVGQVASALEEKQAEKVAAHEPLAGAKGVAGRLYVSTDGVMGPLREAWEEIKVAECYWRDQAGTIHRRYRARTEKIDGFVPHALAVAVACGLEACRESALLGDGAAWIWDRIAPVIDPDVKIVDWRHAESHVWAAGNILHGEGTQACRAWVEPLKGHLWEGRTEVLLEELARIHKSLRSPGKRKAIAGLQTYITNHKQQMAYDQFRAMGLDIGSGLIESACKTVVQQRLKLAGARWNIANAQRILSLRVCHLNGDWDQFWLNRPMAA